MERRFDVFVSSTYEDLIEERKPTNKKSSINWKKFLLNK